MWYEGLHKCIISHTHKPWHPNVYYTAYDKYRKKQNKAVPGYIFINKQIWREWHCLMALFIENNKCTRKNINHCFYYLCKISGSVPTRNIQDPSPPPLQFWSLFHERCADCWNEWKKQFSKCYFSCYRKNSSKIDRFQKKNDHNSKNRNWKFDFPKNLIS